MPSEFYTENWESTNKWLQENAPDYVIQCIQELAALTMRLGKDALETDLAIQRLESKMLAGSAEIAKILQEIARGNAETQAELAKIDAEYKAECEANGWDYDGSL